MLMRIKKMWKLLGAVLRLQNDLFFLLFQDFCLCGLCPEYFVHLCVPIFGL